MIFHLFSHNCEIFLDIENLSALCWSEHRRSTVWLVWLNPGSPEAAAQAALGRKDPRPCNFGSQLTQIKEGFL